MVFGGAVPLMREELLTIEAVLSCKYIGVFASKATVSQGEKTGTWFQIISLNTLMSIEELPGVVIVKFPGGVEPGLVNLI